MEQECIKEPIGSPVGTVLLKVKKTPSGIRLRGKGDPWEMLNIAATIIDNVAVDTQIQIEDVIGAIAEILFQSKPEEKEEVIVV